MGNVNSNFYYLKEGETHILVPSNIKQDVPPTIIRKVHKHFMKEIDIFRHTRSDVGKLKKIFLYYNNTIKIILFWYENVQVMIIKTDTTRTYYITQEYILCDIGRITPEGVTMTYKSEILIEDILNQYLTVQNSFKILDIVSFYHIT